MGIKIVKKYELKSNSILVHRVIDKQQETIKSNQGLTELKRFHFMDQLVKFSAMCVINHNTIKPKIL